MKLPGRLIAFEGIDGSGKTTQLQLADKHLRSVGCNVVTLREPGGTRLGEQLRTSLKDPVNKANTTAQLFIVLASRAQQVAENILPAMARGDIVLIDRYTASTVAYQGYAGSLSLPDVYAMCNLAAAGISPNLTLWFDVSPSVAQKRLSARETVPDLFDEKHEDFMHQVRYGYRCQHDAKHDTWQRIDADLPVDAVAHQVRQALLHLSRIS